MRTEATSSGINESSLWSVWAWISELTVFLAVPLVILVFNTLVIVELRRIDRCRSVSTLTNVSVGSSGRAGSLHKQTVGGARCSDAFGCVSEIDFRCGTSFGIVTERRD
jgi:hypothetical protein